MANRILQHASTPLLTYTQLQSLIGSPHDPCPTCNGIDFGVTHKGEWICVDCDPGLALAPKGIALSVRLTRNAAGQIVAADREQLVKDSATTQALQQAGASVITVDGQQWAAWVDDSGDRRFANIDYHGLDRCLQMASSKRPAQGW
jgi:hypothetical protein